MDDENDNRNVTLTVKNVTPESRYMFNTICQALGRDRGEYLSAMLVEETIRVFGEAAPEHYTKSFHEYQEELRQRKPKKQSDSHPTDEPS